VATSKPIRYLTSYDRFIAAVEILVVLYFIVEFIIREITEIVEQRSGYLKTMWNYYEWILILVFSTIVALRIADLVILSKLNTAPSSDEYVEFGTLATVESVEKDLTAFLVLMASLRAIKFLKLLPATGPVTQSILNTVKDKAFVVFVTVFIYVLFSFSLVYHISFAYDIYEVRNVGEALMELFSMMLGGFDYSKYRASNRVFGPLFFVLFMAGHGLILANMFIAVVSDLYMELRNKDEHYWEMFITTLLTESLRRKRKIQIFIEYVFKFIDSRRARKQVVQMLENATVNDNNDDEGNVDMVDPIYRLSQQDIYDLTLEENTQRAEKSSVEIYQEITKAREHTAHQVHQLSKEILKYQEQVTALQHNQQEMKNLLHQLLALQQSAAIDPNLNKSLPSLTSPSSSHRRHKDD
jgi:hypothetical protein